MTDWVTITDSQVDPDAPITSGLGYAWRDNPIAIAEGALGAPRIAFDALDTWYVTAGAVGTYCFARRATGTTDVAFGSTLAGSSLSPTSALSAANFADANPSLAIGSALSGTWRAMGQYDHADGSASNLGATLWLRIS